MNRARHRSLPNFHLSSNDFFFAYRDTINSETNGLNCIYCSNRMRATSFNLINNNSIETTSDGTINKAFIHFKLLQKSENL